MASFLLGYATQIAHDYTQNWPGERGSELGLYFADDWRISKKLTLNLGVRWDYFSPFSEFGYLAKRTEIIPAQAQIDRQLFVTASRRRNTDPVRFRVHPASSACSRAQSAWRIRGENSRDYRRPYPQDFASPSMRARN